MHCRVKNKTKKQFNKIGDSDFEISQRDLARELGITQQAVNLIEKRALKKFKQKFFTLCPDVVKLFNDDIRTGRW